jgi:hypothetical protein
MINVVVRRPLVGAWQRARAEAAREVYRWLVCASVPFFLVAAMFTYYGQLNRHWESDTYGTVYTAVSLVQTHSIWIDRYLPYFQQHGAGQNPYMLAFVSYGSGGHYVNATPSASSVLALPVVALFAAVGVKASNWHAWMEAGMLTAAIATAVSVALMFLLLTRLTTRRRAALIAATYAWGTLEWGISGQALWEHTGASLALVVALLALVDRRLTLAGLALAAMVAFRPSTPILAVLLLPLVGRRVADWGRFLLGVAPFAVALGLYNTIVFGSPIHIGYGVGSYSHALTQSFALRGGHLIRGIPGLLVSPGRGLFVYSPVLAFAIFGAIRGRRSPLYLWCAIATIVYVVVIGNDVQWYGGESFGARKLTDVIPLLTVLLVPAVDAIVRTRWIWLYVGLLAWSVFVELLEASAQPPTLWFNGPHPHDLTQTATWWKPTDNELVTMLQTNGLVPRLIAMTAIIASGIVLGRLANGAIGGLRGVPSR